VGEEYRSLNSLFSFIHSPVTSSSSFGPCRIKIGFETKNYFKQVINSIKKGHVCRTVGRNSAQWKGGIRYDEHRVFCLY
jgi:hypothetical protein